MNWIRILDNDNFIVEYDSVEYKMRISYFDNGHFQNDIVFDAYLRCLGCKYYDIENGNCEHPNANYCLNGELYWPKGE